MNFQYVLVTLLCMAGISGMAQKHDQNWVAGSSFTDTIYMINFSDTGLAYVPIVPPIEQVRGSFGISDKDGELQFYTNGNYMVSWNHVIMENGDSLNLGAWTSQNNTFPEVKNAYLHYIYQVLPDPEDEKVYYMIHSFMKYGKYPVDQVSTRLQITKIDMKENKGIGRVIYKNKTLYSHELACRFTIIQHGNGLDWWILVRELNGKKYHNLLLHKDSLVAVNIQDTPEGSGATIDDLDSLWTCRYMSIAAQNGQVIVDPIGTSLRRLYHFDRCKGELEYANSLFHARDTFYNPGGSGGPGGIEGMCFSPSGQYLYGVTRGGYFQWDVEAQDISGSEVQLSGHPLSFDNPINPALYNVTMPFMQLGPDGRIYALHTFTHNIVNNPNEKGAASDFCHAPDDTVSCLGVPYSFFIPMYPNYRLGPLEGSVCDTISTAVSNPAKADYSIKTYPNPGIGEVQVEISLPEYGKGRVTLDVVDALGRIVHQHEFPAYAYLYHMDVSGWPAGMYTEVLSIDQRVVTTSRFVVLGEK